MMQGGRITIIQVSSFDEAATKIILTKNWYCKRMILIRGSYCKTFIALTQAIHSPAIERNIWRFNPQASNISKTRWALLVHVLTNPTFN